MSTDARTDNGLGTVSPRRRVWSGGTRWAAGLIGGGVVIILVVLSPWNLLAQRHSRPQFPGTVSLAFLGNTGVAVAGTSGLVGMDPSPNVGFRVTITPRRGEVIRLLGATVMSSDRAGHASGGGRWDTHAEWTRPLGIIRDGRVVNWGPKRLLHLEIRNPATLDLYFDDGTMTRFWPYFAFELEAAGRFVYSAVIEQGTWRVLRER